MATIISLFGGGSTEPPKESASEQPPEQTAEAPVADKPDGMSEEEFEYAKLIMRDIAYVRVPENLERVKRACEHGDQITIYIFSMDGFVKKDESVELRQNTLKKDSLKLLCAYLLDSHEHQWNVQPHYFGAIILEAKDRLNMIRLATGDATIPDFKE